MQQNEPTVNKFTLSFPLWLVAHAGIKISGLLPIKKPTGEKAILIFTDKDLAERELESCPPKHRADFVLREISDPLAVYGLLLLIKKDGYTHVLIDSAPGKQSPAVPIGSAIEGAARWFA